MMSGKYLLTYVCIWIPAKPSTHHFFKRSELTLSQPSAFGYRQLPSIKRKYALNYVAPKLRLDRITPLAYLPRPYLVDLAPFLQHDLHRLTLCKDRAVSCLTSLPGFHRLVTIAGKHPGT